MQKLALLEVTSTPTRQTLSFPKHTPFLTPTPIPTPNFSRGEPKTCS